VAALLGVSAASAGAGEILEFTVPFLVRFDPADLLGRRRRPV
jgi:hypothetical protein